MMGEMNIYYFYSRRSLTTKPKAKGFLKCTSIKHKGIFETYSKG